MSKSACTLPWIPFHWGLFKIKKKLEPVSRPHFCKTASTSQMSFLDCVCFSRYSVRLFLVLYLGIWWHETYDSKIIKTWISQQKGVLEWKLKTFLLVLKVLPIRLKTSKFVWMLENIRIKKIISAKFWPKNFFLRFQRYYLLDIVPSCNHGQYQGKLMMEPWENGKNPILISNLIWGLKKFFQGFYIDNLPSYHPMQFPRKLMN